MTRLYAVHTVISAVLQLEICNIVPTYYCSDCIRAYLQHSHIIYWDDCMKTQSCGLEAFLRSKDTFLQGISFSMVGNVRKWTVARVREV